MCRRCLSLKVFKGDFIHSKIYEINLLPFSQTSKPERILVRKQEQPEEERFRSRKRQVYGHQFLTEVVIHGLLIPEAIENMWHGSSCMERKICKRYVAVV